MSNKVLARAFVKIALSEDKQIAINAAESAQMCGADLLCAMKKLTPAESKELRIWIDMKVKEHELSSEVVS